MMVKKAPMGNKTSAQKVKTTSFRSIPLVRAYAAGRAMAVPDIVKFKGLRMNPKANIVVV